MAVASFIARAVSIGALSCVLACGSGNDDINTSPVVTFTVKNQTPYDLELRGNTWLTIEGHPDWLVWPTPAGYDGGSSTCEDAKFGVVPVSPPEAVIHADDSLDYKWKTNHFGSIEDSALNLFGKSFCVHIERVPEGHYSVLACAQLYTVSCTNVSAVSSDDRRKTCFNIPLDIGNSDVSIEVPFTPAQFPTNVCASDLNQ